MSTPTLWLTILGVGVVTFALRLSFIALLGRVEVPPFLERALRFVPAAVLTAVVVPLAHQKRPPDPRWRHGDAVDASGRGTRRVMDARKEHQPPPRRSNEEKGGFYMKA